jgi:hypothetical protein
MNDKVRVSFRWGKAQVDVIKRAAALVGIPYQAYIKVAVYELAVKDLQFYKTIPGAIKEEVCIPDPFLEGKE